MFDNIISIIVVIAVITFIVYRQIRPRKISQKGLIILPAIILFFIIKSLPSFHPTQKEITEMILMSIITIILGLLACRQLHIYEGSTGKAMAKGNWTYFLWWLAAFVIKSILSVALGETSLSSVNQTELYLPIFLLMATRNAYIYWKTQKLGLILH